MNGLFNLGSVGSDDEVLSLNIESAEFSENDPATNPTVDFDKDATSASEHNISVPGGLKETPSAKPYDATSMPAGGETPNAKPYDSASITIPKGTTLTSKEYNDALDALQKSFKEGAEMLDALRQVTVVEESVEERQQRYVESVLDEALLEAYENGPIFEAVKKDDKDAVKAIVKTLRGKIPGMLKGAGIKFKPPKTFLRLLLNSRRIGGMHGTETSKDNVADTVSWWTTRFWQVLGVVYCENANIKTLIEKLNNELADELNGYKILYSLSIPGLYDLWNLKFGWKNRKEVYFLIVDKKLPKELKELQKDMADAISEDKKDSNDESSAADKSE